MLHNLDFIRDFMAYYHYPEEAVETFTRLQKRAESEAEFGEKLENAVNDYMDQRTDWIGSSLDAMSALGKETGEHEYSMHFLFLLNCAPILKKRYEEAGYSEELYYASMEDLRFKLLECMECEGIPGTFVAGWNEGTLKMGRFALGRFQYELCRREFDKTVTLSDGTVIESGALMVNFHIPSSGVSLTDEVRMDSYRRAYAFYKDNFPDGKVIFCCHSWLLYPRHAEFLPKDSNILRFLGDFQIVSWNEKEAADFDDKWRIFGRYTKLPPKDLPRDTKLRRAYADRLSEEKKVGSGFGIFAFDGEHIIR